eukprot:TRINITY_DN63293_c0_g1_i1.p1 TRINITY_DN63293_c0_g1~~TRINITY_DN63293_c0_g1_i1.p1  ORF type:complete len:434 (+),score=72.04 TRINITY_DN63293_c0_g1_i1:27-1328(+)
MMLFSHSVTAASLLSAVMASPDNPAGNGYKSPKLRLPKWPPTYDMKRSTILMPCNYSGWHSVDEALQYGLVSYDWANAKSLWSEHSPVDDESLLVAQADMVIAADPAGRTRIGVYRNTIKAFNWFGKVIQEKLDDPNYAGWFIQYRNCTGPESNRSYSPPACTLEKCSCAWHDHAGQLGGGTQDCGQSPCGGYVFDHRNASFADWFVNEFIITEDTILRKGITELYLDDRVETWGISEAEGHFVEDTGLTLKERQALKDAFDRNMEKVYDLIIERGAFAWQMLDAGPFVVPAYFPNGSLKPNGMVQPDKCAEILRSYCNVNSTAAQRALAYTNNPNPDNASIQAAQYAAVFLLTRGDYAWIGYDYRGCKSKPYPRPQEWDTDYGEPISTCAETSLGSRLFRRQWSRASVEWDCNSGRGTIALTSVAASTMIYT